MGHGKKDRDAEVDGVPVPVFVTDEAWSKIIAYCRSAKPDEIMGMAWVREHDDGLEIYDPFILKQKVGPTTCEFDRADFARFMATVEDPKSIKCIWHSHVEMSAFFSSCDRGTSEGMAALGRVMGGSSSWFLSLVVNLRQEYQAKVDFYRPFKLTIPGEINRYIADPGPEMEAEVEQKLESFVYQNTTTHSHNPPKGQREMRGFSQTDLDDLYAEHDHDPGRYRHFAFEGSENVRQLDSMEFDSIFDIVKQATHKGSEGQEKKDEGSGKSGS